MRRVLTAVSLALLLGACAGDEPTAPRAHPVAASESLDLGLTLAQEVRQLAEGRGIGPLAGPPRVRPALVHLGQALAFDPILAAAATSPV